MNRKSRNELNKALAAFCVATNKPASLFSVKNHPADRVSWDVVEDGKRDGAYQIVRVGGQGRVIVGYADGFERAKDMAREMAAEGK
jgi:hypothetical protein